MSLQPRPRPRSHPMTVMTRDRRDWLESMARDCSAQTQRATLLYAQAVEMKETIDGLDKEREWRYAHPLRNLWRRMMGNPTWGPKRPHTGRPHTTLSKA